MESGKYKSFLSDLCDEEPEHGFLDATDLPHDCLTDAHRALMLRARPDVMDRLTLEPQLLATLLAHPDTSPVARNYRLGMYLLYQLDAALHRQLVSDLQEACERRREAEEWDRQSERANRINPLVTETPLPEGL